MKRIILISLLILPLFVFSQEFKKSDLIGNWEFESAEKNTEISNDSLSKLLTKEYGIEVFVTDEKIIRSDLKITNDHYKVDEFESDSWTISKNEIIVNTPVPSDKLEYYKKTTVGVIEKFENGKYYFIGQQTRIKILSLKENELVITDFPYKLTYIKK
ncbi:hypothetical protein [Seonamhaeicola sp. ML3]|uniref:hypothetical protein n=1 Tax=Seonamhaeicola sp. ML3 TaxID=2937786 RepID=UPI00200D5509|nr:hypothetical protein [Seonamhaeicola sp. ML3]